MRAEFAAAGANALRLDPRSEGTSSQLGHRYLQLYRRFGESMDLYAAQRHYEDAVRKYPHNAMVNAQLAWVLNLTGDDPQAAVEAQTALDLDRRHAHTEYKLRARSLVDVEPAPGLRQIPPPADRTAEPILERLRKASKP